MNKKVISGVSAFGVAVIGTGIYLAGPASAGGGAQDTAATATQHKQQAGQQKNARQRMRKAIRRRGIGVHGDATLRTKKGFVQVAWQRGMVTGKSGNTLTVRSLDGTTWQWQTDGNTKVRKQGAKAAIANVATNDFVIIAGQQGAGNRHTAKRIFDPKKVPAKATQSPEPSHS